MMGCVVTKFGDSGLTLSTSYQQGYSSAYTTRSRVQVVCKGSIPARHQIAMRPSPTAFPAGGQRADGSKAEAYSYPRTACRRASSRSGMDSDLEAFSHNPADGSVAALPGRTAAKTNYLKPRFLSY